MFKPPRPPGRQIQSIRSFHVSSPLHACRSKARAALRRPTSYAMVDARLAPDIFINVDITTGFAWTKKHHVKRNCNSSPRKARHFVRLCRLKLPRSQGAIQAAVTAHVHGRQTSTLLVPASPYEGRVVHPLWPHLLWVTSTMSSPACSAQPPPCRPSSRQTMDSWCTLGENTSC